MDLQSILDNAMAAKRNARMATSDQMTLGELILKMENVKDKSKPVIFDVKPYCPDSIDSWRGSYAELALGYHDGVAFSGSDFLKILKETVGITLSGYKGGNFLMGKTTPVWVADYGNSYGFRENKDDESFKDYTAVVDVKETKTNIVIKTKLMDF